MVACVTKSRNGRKAWKNLLLHFEGSTYKERLAQEAGSILKNTSYSGPRRNFSFGDYYKRHALAHTKLESANKPMTTEQKIDTFVQGMQCSTAQNIVVNIAGIDTHRSTFDAYYNAVASKLELALSLTNKSTETETRNVNSVDQKKRKFTPKSDKNPRKRFVPEDRTYTSSEWAARTPDERKQIRALHRERKNKPSRFTRQTSYPSQNVQHNLPTQQSRALVPYVPPAHGPQFSGRNVSQQYQPYAYGMIHENDRMINSATYPPPPIGHFPPPPPPNRPPSHGSINVNQGEIGSYFGGPYHHS